MLNAASPAVSERAIAIAIAIDGSSRYNTVATQLAAADTVATQLAAEKQRGSGGRFSPTPPAQTATSGHEATIIDPLP